MRVIIDHGKFSPEQYIIPQRSAMTHGVNRRLLFDYQLYLQQHFSLA